MDSHLEGSGGGSLSPPLSNNNNNNNNNNNKGDIPEDAEEIQPIIPPSRPMHAAMSNPFVDGNGDGGGNVYAIAPGASIQNSVHTTRRFAQRATDSSSTINQQQNVEKGGGKNTYNTKAKPSTSAADSNGTRGNTYEGNAEVDGYNDYDNGGEEDDHKSNENNKKNKARTTRSSGSLHSEEVEGGGAPKAGSLNGTEAANTDGRPEVESKEKKVVTQQRRRRQIGSTNNNNEDGVDTFGEAAAVVNETAPLPPTNEYEYKEPWDIPSAELIPAAMSLKCTADAYQNDGRFDNAERTYGMALRFIEHESLFDSVGENVKKQITDAKGNNLDIQLASKSELTVACLIEASVCALKRGDASRAGDLASRVLNNSKNNTLALKARAQARLAEGDFRNALADCDEALKLEKHVDKKAEFERLRKEIETRSEELSPMCGGKQQQHEFEYGIQNAAVMRNTFAAYDGADNEPPVGKNVTAMRTMTWQAEVEGESEGGRTTMDTEPGAAFKGIVREKIIEEGYDRDHGQTLLNVNVEKKDDPNGTTTNTNVGDTTAQLNKTHLPTQQATTHEQPLRSQDGGIQGSLLIGSVGGGGNHRTPVSRDSNGVQAVLISNSTQRALGGTYSIQKDHRPTDALVESDTDDEEGEEVCGGK